LSKDKLFTYSGLRHGGNVLAMAKKYSIPELQLLDLSTGLNPNGWPVAAVPNSVWQSLPQSHDELQEAACEYYECDACLPIAGSQAAIQLLPTLRNFSKVGIISPTYAEHEHAWRKEGHDVFCIDIDEVASELDSLDVLVVINPNNPTGDIVSVDTLLNWHQSLSKKGGWLIVDEAFMDVTPELSLLGFGTKPGLIILRSLGKFFGLAGIRSGFVISHHDLLKQLAEKIGPWSVTGPSRYIAIQALRDTKWQYESRKQLIQSGKKLKILLKKNDFLNSNGSALFQWVKHEKASEIFDLFAKQGVLLRLFEEQSHMPPSLRFGLPKNEKQWLLLEDALNIVEKLKNDIH